MQENRPAPETGTAHKAVPGAAITLASRHGKGQSVAVADQVEIVSLRSFSAVSVRMPEPLVRDLVGDPADATLSIGQLMSALPVAARAAKSNTANRHTTQTLIGMVNRLPADRITTATQMTAMRDLADATLGQSPETAQRIAYALDRCAVKVRYQMYPHLRACLGNQHDLYNSVTTQSVWKALQPVASSPETPFRVRGQVVLLMGQPDFSSRTRHHKAGTTSSMKRRIDRMTRSRSRPPNCMKQESCSGLR